MLVLLLVEVVLRLEFDSNCELLLKALALLMEFISLEAHLLVLVVQLMECFFLSFALIVEIFDSSIVADVLLLLVLVQLLVLYVVSLERGNLELVLSGLSLNADNLLVETVDLSSQVLDVSFFGTNNVFKLLNLIGQLLDFHNKSVNFLLVLLSTAVLFLVLLLVTGDLELELLDLLVIVLVVGASLGEGLLSLSKLDADSIVVAL